MSAPKLPSEPMLFQRAQRFVVPFSLGLVASFTGIPQKTIFLLMTLLCCCVVLFLFDRILTSLQVNDNSYFLCVSLLVLNPYVFRLYLMLPGMISDLVFVLGLALCLLGLMKEKFAILLAGVVVAAVARQTALLLLPGLIAWLWFCGGWKSRTLAWKLFYSIAIVLSVSGIYKITATIAASFSTVNTNLTFITGIFPWLRSSFSLPGVAEFFLRLSIPHMFVLCLLAATFIALRSQIRFRCEFWICVLLAACIAAQPLLAGPHASAGGVVRLSSFGFLPLLTALAIIAAENKLLRNPNLILFGLLLVTIAGASFHHVFSIARGNASHFAMIYFTLAFAAGLLCFWLSKRQDLKRRE